MKDSVTKIKYATWEKKGEELFGESKKDWRFQCPMCKTVQSYATFKTHTDLDDERIRGVIHFSCVGRWSKTKGFGCNYSSGGLFNLSPLRVFHRGRWFSCMGFQGSPEIPNDEIVERAELKKLEEATGDAEVIAWPDWVPEAVRKQIADFYKWHNGPKGYFESCERNETPDFGYEDEFIVGRDKIVSGRYVHAWNNIGRVVLPDGSYEVTSI